MSFTIEEATKILAEAKALKVELKSIAHEFKGYTDKEGNQKAGLIEQLENLYAKLNPTSIAFLGNLAREKAIESLQQIEELQNDQKAYFETQNHMFERRIKELIEEYEKINQEAKKIAITDFNEKAKDLRFSFGAELQDFKNHLNYHLDNVKELEPALNEVVNMRYMYVSIFSVAIFMIGMALGSFLFK